MNSNSTRQTANRTRAILVRHGRSTYNEQGRFQGSCNDSVLTTKGKKSAPIYTSLESSPNISSRDNQLPFTYKFCAKISQMLGSKDCCLGALAGGAKKKVS